MASQAKDASRHIVPRWRKARTTSAYGELASVQEPHERLWDPKGLESDLALLRSSPTATLATDVMGGAIVLRKPNVAHEAAEIVIQGGDCASLAARRMAAGVLEGRLAAGYCREPEASQPAVDPQRRISAIKTRLKKMARNPILWIDLAREYVINGQAAAAQRPIEVATFLAPNNRFVIRSATRYYLHIHDRKKAHDFVRSAPGIDTDPWLLVTEIAVAAAAGRVTRHAKRSRILLAGGYRPFHLSELACALGTLEAEAGKRRISRKLFRQALIEPTENAVAQVSWAIRRMPGLPLGASAPVELSNEALAWDQLTGSNWLESVEAARRWMDDEPFGSRPAAFGSWIASAGLQDYSLAAGFAAQALTVSRDDPLLLNNLAFAQANMDDTKAAAETLSRIDIQALNQSLMVSFLATSGLVAFRSGDRTRGRQLYEESGRLATRSGASLQAIWAMLYRAREEAIAGDPIACDLLKSAQSRIPKVGDDGYRAVSQQIVSEVRQALSGPKKDRQSERC